MASHAAGADSPQGVSRGQSAGAHVPPRWSGHRGRLVAPGGSAQSGKLRRFATALAGRASFRYAPLRATREVLPGPRKGVQGGTAQPTAAPVTAFDGTYTGTGQGVSGCGAPTSFPVRMIVNGGTATIALRGGRSVTARVATDGTMSRITYSDTQFSSSGNGRIADGAFNINLTTSGGGGSCGFRYSGQRQG